MRLPKLPVALLVGFCLFALAAFAGGAVLSVGYGIALKNTRELLYGNADLSIAALRQGITGHLDPVAGAVDDLAEILARDPRARTDDAALATVLQAAMAGLPQVTALAVVDRDYRVFRIIRDPARASLKWANWSQDRRFRETVDGAVQLGRGQWGAPFYAETARISLLNYYRPLADGDDRLKALAAVISLEQLSDYMIALSDRPQQVARIRPFVLYGRDRVLAHPLFLAGYPGLSDAEPLPKLTDFTDPVLANLWRTDPNAVESIEASLLHNADARIIDSGGTRYLAIYTGLSGYGPREMLLGAYVASSEARVQLDRLAILPQVAAVLLVVVLGLAWIIALTASLAVLFIGEVLGQTPCVLCWFQRAFMFPLAIVLGLGLWWQDRRVGSYGLVLSLGGGAVALWHLGLYFGVIPEPVQPCTASGPSCTDDNQLIFGVPIPLLSVIAFALVAALSAASLKDTRT